MTVPSKEWIWEMFQRRIKPDVFNDVTQEVFAVMLQENPDVDPDELFDAASDLVESWYPSFI